MYGGSLKIYSRDDTKELSRQLITPENTELLIHHSLRCIDSILAEMPRIKLLFWCLAKRTFNKQGPSKQIPTFGQYAASLQLWCS